LEASYPVVILRLLVEQRFQPLKGVHLHKWLTDKVIKMSQPRIKNQLGTCKSMRCKHR
jgi:hypothetical protein